MSFAGGRGKPFGGIVPSWSRWLTFSHVSRHQIQVRCPQLLTVTGVAIFLQEWLDRAVKIGLLAGQNPGQEKREAQTHGRHQFNVTDQ
jgi:hypothetical protein